LKKILLACFVFVFAVTGSAQIQSTTPRLNLQIPLYGATQWQVPVNYNWNLLDKTILGVPPGSGIVYATNDPTGGGSRVATAADLLSLMGAASGSTDGYLLATDWARFNAGSSAGLAAPGVSGIVFATGPGNGTRTAASADLISALLLNQANGLLQLDGSNLIPSGFQRPSSASNFGAAKDVHCSAGSAVTDLAAGLFTCNTITGGGGVTPPGSNNALMFFTTGTTSRAATQSDILTTLGTTLSGTGTQMMTGLGSYSNGHCANIQVSGGHIDITDSGGACGGSPSFPSINVNNGLTGGTTITAQAKVYQYAYVEDFGAVGDGTTDDTAAVTKCSAQSFVCNFRSNHTYRLHNPTISNHTELRGGAGVKFKDANTDAVNSTLKITFLSDFKMSDITIDQNGNQYGSAGGGNGIIYLQQNSKAPIFNNVQLTNSGTLSQYTKGWIIFNSPATVLNSGADNTIIGTHNYVEPANDRVNRVVFDNFRSDGSQANAFYLYGDSGGVCNVLIANSYISNVGDAFVGDTGSFGNGVDIDHCNGASVVNTNYYNMRFSCTRVFVGNENQFLGGTCDTTAESAAYSEFGGVRNVWRNMTFKHFLNGINITNVSNESPEDWSIVSQNYFIDGQDHAVVCEECVAEDLTIENTPVGVRAGNGSTTHNSIVRNISCRNTGDPTMAQSDACVVADPLVNSGVDVFSNVDAVGGAMNVATFISSIGNAQVTNLTRGTTTAITYTGTVGGSGFGNGATVCFADFLFDTTHEINGRCGLVSAWTSSTFTVAVNSTGFTAWNPASLGQYPYFWVAYTAGTTPAYQTTQYMKLNSIAVNYGWLGTVASGSDFYVNDGTCTAGVLSGGGLGAKAFGIAGSTSCYSPGSGGGGGSSVFSALTGASAPNTLSNGDQAQQWNWLLTTANKSGLTISESAASSASGTPILFRVSSVATSTAYPVLFSARGTANGVLLNPSGILTAIPGGTGGIDAAAIVVNQVPVARMPILGSQDFAASAGCAQGQPFTVFDLPSTSAPTPNCYGTSYAFGSLDYADAAPSTSSVRYVIPGGTNTQDIDFYWFVNAASQQVKWTVAVACIPAGNDELNPVFLSAQTITSTSAATANTMTIATLTNLVMTGCASGQEEILKLGRDTTDTSAATASLRGVRLTNHITPSN
jgi:hypothetical protein